MKKEKIAVDKYWEKEEGETVEFEEGFMRCFEKAGKLQLGKTYFDSKTGAKQYAVKYVLDRDKLLNSKEGLDYLKATIVEWEEKRC